MEQAFDLVILDRAMPDLTGDEVAIGLKRRKPNLPILLLTGLGELMRKAGEQPRSVDGILGKPVTMGELHKAINAVLKDRSQSVDL